jgi:hypothetical protein
VWIRSLGQDGQPGSSTGNAYDVDSSVALSYTDFAASVQGQVVVQILDKSGNDVTSQLKTLPSVVVMVYGPGPDAGGNTSLVGSPPVVGVLGIGGMATTPLAFNYSFPMTTSVAYNGPLTTGARIILAYISGSVSKDGTASDTLASPSCPYVYSTILLRPGSNVPSPLRITYKAKSF